jgi:pyruvate dehydrogenase E2 component (dihydrolipoamide acetyltransferase)
MATRIVVPDAGQTTDEMLLVKWHVHVGDKVEAAAVLADIETDKAVVELESHVAGHVLTLMAAEGDTVRTGQTLLWIGGLGEGVPDDSVEEVEGQRTSSSSIPEPLVGIPEPRSPAGGRVRATPAARTLGRERGILLTNIAGSGPDGCIVKEDVLTAAPHAPAGRDAPLRGTSVPLSSMRRAIASRLQQSVQQAPQFYVQIEVDMTRALAVHHASEANVTITDAIVKAAADTLAEYPRINCRLERDTVHYSEDVNIGIAVSVEDGLLVPVLARADKLTLAEIAERSRHLIANARTGRLPGGVHGTFTVSNLGMYGVRSFTAIINPPEVAILAVGALEDKPILTRSGIVAVPTLILTLSSDHRIIDGDLAARFLRALKGRLENLDPTPP